MSQENSTKKKPHVLRFPAEGAFLEVIPREVGRMVFNRFNVPNDVSVDGCKDDPEIMVEVRLIATDDLAHKIWNYVQETYEFFSSED